MTGRMRRVGTGIKKFLFVEKACMASMSSWTCLAVSKNLG